MKERTGLMKKVYSHAAKGNGKAIYAEWADSYDEDLIDNYGYVAPQIGADIFQQRFQDRHGEIIDIGCGTGLAGRELVNRGYQTIDGLDFSAEMLGKAREKNIYRDLFPGDLTTKLDIPDNRYSAMICIGVFANSIVGPDRLTELVRIVEPGGVICVSINGLYFEERNFKSMFEALEKEQRAVCEEIQHADYIQETGVDGYFATLKVL